MTKDDGGEVATTERKRPSAGDAGAALVLTVVEGPDRGARLVVGAGGRALVGQSAACGLRLTDPAVSRRHLAVDVASATAGGARLLDLRSRNGTTVNGVRVIEAEVVGGELLRIGDTVLTVTREADVANRERRDRFRRLLGRSAAMRALYPVCDRLAASDVPIVIEGETGTGKELLAECLHEAGPRAAAPFVVFDATRVAPRDVETVLFGVEGGAPGLFEQAQGGTLLVDEIADLTEQVQATLLRAIDRGEIVRVGSTRGVPVRVRVVATTRRDLDREVQAGRFRDDLFYRLAVARIELPPLRARAGDVPILATHFWRTFHGGAGAPPPDLLERFADLEWRGNVRELANAVARRVALGEDAPAASRPVGTEQPPREGSTRPPQLDPIESVLALDLPLGPTRERIVDELERRYVTRVLAKHGGNVAKAAEASGIARRYFQILRARQSK